MDKNNQAPRYNNQISAKSQLPNPILDIDYWLLKFFWLLYLGICGFHRKDVL